MTGEPTPSPAGGRSVLFANVSRYAYAKLAPTLGELGFVSSGLVWGRSSILTSVSSGEVDVVVVGRSVGDDAEALGIVRWVAHDVGAIVVVQLLRSDPAFVAAAAERGAFAAIVGTSPSDWESALAIALERGSQYRNLQDAFERRGVVERAKGILMARNRIDETAAFELLRRQARRRSVRVVDVAHAVVARQQALGMYSELLS